MAETDALRICSEALVLLGERPIASFEEGGDPAVAARALYQPLADRLGSGHPWRFTRRVVRLARLAEAPPAATGYDAAYQIPNDIWRLVAVFVANEATDDFMVTEGSLLVAAEASQEVAVQGHGRVDETLWTPAFREAVVLGMASALAVPIRDSAQLRGVYNQDMELQLARARHQNATEQPTQALPTGRLAGRRSL
jgi:hypothetical protein